MLHVYPEFKIHTKGTLGPGVAGRLVIRAVGASTVFGPKSYLRPQSTALAYLVHDGCDLLPHEPADVIRCRAVPRETQGPRDFESREYDLHKLQAPERHPRSGRWLTGRSLDGERYADIQQALNEYRYPVDVLTIRARAGFRGTTTSRVFRALHERGLSYRRVVAAFSRVAGVRPTLRIRNIGPTEAEGILRGHSHDCASCDAWSRLSRLLPPRFG